MQCVKSCDCALFTGKLSIPEDTRLMYNCIYCLGRETGWKSCKRFVLLETDGFCPDFVMPNTLLTFEQIRNRMKLQLI